MSKSTDTPDSTTPDQAHGQELRPTAEERIGPFRIYTADRKFCLGYRNATDNYIKTVSPGSAFFQEWIIETYGQSSCRIICATSGLFLDGETKFPLAFVRAKSDTTSPWKGWTYTQTGTGPVYFTNNANDEILSVSSTPQEGIGVTTYRRTAETPTANQKFLIDS